MYKRKKFLGGLRVLLFVLFGMLLGICSTCYANVSEEYVDNMLTTFGNTMVVSSFQPKKRNSFLNHNIEHVNTIVEIINTYLEEKNLQNATDRNIVFGVLSSSQSKASISVFIANNGSPNYIENLDFIVAKFPSTASFYKYFDNKTDVIYVFYINLSINTTNETITDITKGSEYIINNKTQYSINFTQDNYANFTYDSEHITLYSPNVYCAGLPNIYINQNNNITPAFLMNTNGNYTIPVEPDDPEQPSGDSPSIDNTGNITNNSGDITGSIDLSGIQQGIGNIQNQISGDTQKVIENQNQNTEKIVGAINNANENYWGSDDDLNGEQQEEEIENNLNNIIKNVSGELSQNEVIQQLERSRSRLFKFFQGKT